MRKATLVSEGVKEAEGARDKHAKWLWARGLWEPLESTGLRIDVDANAKAGMCTLERLLNYPDQDFAKLAGACSARIEIPAGIGLLELRVVFD
jgi:hypothetical protein